jgi:hypothetical protein
MVYRTLALIGAGLPRSYKLINPSQAMTFVDPADLPCAHLENRSLSRQNQPVNPHILVEACMCLLIYDAENVTFAH